MKSHFQTSTAKDTTGFWIPDVYQEKFHARALAKLPRKLRAFGEETYEKKLKKEGKFAANNFLGDLVEDSLAQVSDELNQEAVLDRASAAVVACMRAEIKGGAWGAIEEGMIIANDYGFDLERLTAIYKIHGEAGMVARLTSADWWRGGILKVERRETEECAIRAGRVSKEGEIYATDVAVLDMRQRKIDAARHMANFDVVAYDADGETELARLDMLQAASAGVSNPAVLHAELMNRINGYQDVAKRRKHVSIFVTATAPSRFHKSGENYSKESTPRNAQKHLTRCWSQCRAAFKKAGLLVYGFRVIEPHHDGCPHWHMIMFMRKSDAPKFREIVADRFRRADAEELTSYAAKRARVDFKTIDPTKGTAAAYVAKYIAKNISGVKADGLSVGDDYEGGGDCAETAERVLVWKSVHGFRQFQAIGGHFISTYREIRRIKKIERESLPDSMVKAWDAAQKTDDKFADFGDFMEALGGIETAPRDALVMLESELEQGEGIYGLMMRRRVLGLRHQEGVLLSNRMVWTVKAKKTAIH